MCVRDSFTVFQIKLSDNSAKNCNYAEYDNYHNEWLVSL